MNITANKGDGSNLDDTDKWPCFIMRFQYQGRVYDLDFFAPSQSHAEAMVAAIRETAEYEGKINDTDCINACGERIT